MSLKLLSQRLRKCSYKTLVTSVMNSPMSPPSLTTMSQENDGIVGSMWSIKKMDGVPHTPLKLKFRKSPSKDSNSGT